jgi:DNA-binding FadR family transcriptional regulator
MDEAVTARTAITRVPTTSGAKPSRGIVEALGRAIVSGASSARGIPTIEAEVCRHLGASRTAMREAVKVLVAKGLLLARPRKGTWVSDAGDWELFDSDVFTWLAESAQYPSLLDEFSQTRLAIEPIAAAIAAASATAEQKQGILETVGKAAAGADAAAAFHLAVLNASGNRFFVQIGKLIEVQEGLNGRAGRALHEEIAGRRRVAEAIVAGDAASAKSAMYELLARNTPSANAGRREAPAVGEELLDEVGVPDATLVKRETDSVWGVTPSPGGQRVQNDEHDR